MLLLALAVMPLQGVAATLSVVLCLGKTQAHAVQYAVQDQGSHDHGLSHHSHQDEGGTNSNHADHPCSHHTVSNTPDVTLPLSLPDFPARAFAPDILHDLFALEPPHRPPLA